MMCSRLFSDLHSTTAVSSLQLITGSVGVTSSDGAPSADHSKVQCTCLNRLIENILLHTLTACSASSYIQPLCLSLSLECCQCGSPGTPPPHQPHVRWQGTEPGELTKEY